ICPREDDVIGWGHPVQFDTSTAFWTRDGKRERHAKGPVWAERPVSFLAPFVALGYCFGATIVGVVHVSEGDGFAFHLLEHQGKRVGVALCHAVRGGGGLRHLPAHRTARPCCLGVPIGRATNDKETQQRQEQDPWGTEDA